MKHKIGIVLFVVFVTSLTLFNLRIKKADSAPPTNVKDTLSSSQLSFFGRLGTGVSAGDSIIRVVTSGTAPSITTNNLFVGDTLGIGTTGAGVGLTGPLTKYTIVDIGNTAAIELNAAVGTSNAFAGAAVIATRSAIHTISFTPQSNSNGGFWQFLIKASSRAGEIQQDGIPDQQGFDLGQDVGGTTVGLGTRLKVLDVTCPNWGIGVTSAYSVGTTVAIGSNYYHVISCYLGVGGTNQVGVGYSLAIGRDLSTGSQLINPSPKDGGRTEGNADTYSFYVRHLDSSSTVIDADTMQAKIAVVEAVRVTATVDPSITFTIGTSNVGTGGTPCGLSAFGSQAASVTPDAVPFGSLTLGAFNNLAQSLHCVTNADNGYVVTVYQFAPMSNIKGNGTTIPDTTCPANVCSTTVAALWTTNSASGWGYAIQNVNVGVSTVDYQTGYRAFGTGANNAQSIMSNTNTPSTTENAYICYRLTASTVQEAGNYENRLIFTATATF
jgi:hypothetical protein